MQTFAYLYSQSQDDVGAEGRDGEGSQVLDALSCEDLGTSLEPNGLLNVQQVNLAKLVQHTSFANGSQSSQDFFGVLLGTKQHKKCELQSFSPQTRCRRTSLGSLAARCQGHQAWPTWRG